jgi:hypothetical protein
MIRPHEDVPKMLELLPFVRQYQQLASAHGIGDIFQDNGGKLLQLLLLTGLRIIPGRLGNDAIDQDGREYELKTVNVLLTKSFSTHHHLNPIILDKYRRVDWIFAVYKGIELERILAMPAAALEPYFAVWEKRWHESGGRDINNPKIPLGFVRHHGTLVYPQEQYETFELEPDQPL